MRRDQIESFIFLKNLLYLELTVKENIQAALEAKQYNQNEIENKINEISYEFNLDGINFQKCNSLSDGQRRRVEIARAMALSPKLILLDEPFAGIDPLVINEIKELLKFKRKRNWSTN